MATFEITIQRVITTVVQVETTSVKNAREQIENYGIGEAWSDYDHISEENTFVIKKIRKI